MIQTKMLADKVEMDSRTHSLRSAESLISAERYSDSKKETAILAPSVIGETCPDLETMISGVQYPNAACRTIIKS